MKSQCQSCANLRIDQEYSPGIGNRWYCGAFPGGIPDEVLSGDFIHDKRHPLQADATCLYERKDAFHYEGNLPLPLVSISQTFFGFRREKNSPMMLCSCAREAIQNYVKFSRVIPRNSDGSSDGLGVRSYVLDSWDFPTQLIESLILAGVPSDESVLGHLSFADRLCHECNRITPPYIYCHPMYGSVFKQKHGWYINKMAYELGVSAGSLLLIKSACPQAVLELIDRDLQERLAIDDPKTIPVWDLPLTRDQHARCAKQWRRVKRVIENEVRARFGYTQIGDAWTSETILYHMIQTLLPKSRIHRHFRPAFLDGLELDIFVEDRNLGIEYQGVQHFKPVRHWGGKAALSKLRERDQRKLAICQRQGVALIYFTYKEELSYRLVQDRLAAVGSVAASDTGEARNE